MPVGIPALDSVAPWNQGVGTRLAIRECEDLQGGEGKQYRTVLACQLASTHLRPTD